MKVILMGCWVCFLSFCFFIPVSYAIDCLSKDGRIQGESIDQNGFVCQYHLRSWTNYRVTGPMKLRFVNKGDSVDGDASIACGWCKGGNGCNLAGHRLKHSGGSVASSIDAGVTCELGVHIGGMVFLQTTSPLARVVQY